MTSSAYVISLYVACSFAEDPEEKNDLAAELPEVVQIMAGRITDLYKRVGDIIVYSSDPAGSYTNYDGVWSPGWC